MKDIEYSIIGLMSGTSGDGLDLVHCTFSFKSEWNYEILKSTTVPFPADLGNRLMNSHRLSALDLSFLDVEFGRWMGEQVMSFTSGSPSKPDAVCSHGHTVFHQPEKGLTLQIGNGWALHQVTGLRVINDFRMLDVQRGGQGAPLVPVGDRLLFDEVDYCINLGGIANLSTKFKGHRIAFDCCPFNLLLNPQANILGGVFDNLGNWAKEGVVCDSLYTKLNAFPFYQNNKAKSLGREDVERDFIPAIQASGLSPRDVLATLIEHYAFQIATSIKKYQLVDEPSVLITGGGAYNLFFKERLNYHLSGNLKLYPSSRQLIEFKEALIFGFLGVLRLRNEINCLASVTGASRDSCGGVIYG